MSASGDYEKLISEIIGKQKEILGTDVALRTAAKVKGLKISADGQVVGLGGEGEEILRQLVEAYIALSGEIVKNILTPVFAKYPEIKLPVK